MFDASKITDVEFSYCRHHPPVLAEIALWGISGLRFIDKNAEARNSGKLIWRFVIGHHFRALLHKFCVVSVVGGVILKVVGPLGVNQPALARQQCRR